MNAPANAADVWQPKTPPLSTPWTQLVGPNNALPDYPRPQLARTKWLNLNGLWGYTGRPANAAAKVPPPENEYREQILVPTRRNRRCRASSATTIRCGTARCFRFQATGTTSACCFISARSTKSPRSG